MNCVTWNVRGVCAPLKAKSNGRWLKEHEVSLVGILENRVKVHYIDRTAAGISRSWNWTHKVTMVNSTIGFEFSLAGALTW